MFCKYCGQKLSDDSVFCLVCGKKIKEDLPATKVSPILKTDNIVTNTEKKLTVDASKKPEVAIAKEIMTNLTLLGIVVAITFVSYFFFRHVYYQNLINEAVRENKELQERQDYRGVL